MNTIFLHKDQIRDLARMIPVGSPVIYEYHSDAFLRVENYYDQDVHWLYFRWAKTGGIYRAPFCLGRTTAQSNMFAETFADELGYVAADLCISAPVVKYEFRPLGNATAKWETD